MVEKAEQASTFLEVSDKFVLEQMAILKQAAREKMTAEELELEKTLNPEQCSTQPFEKHFLCSICLNVVLKPHQCSTCENLNCSDCIDAWLGKSKECPNCRESYVKTKVNRFTLQVLENTSFDCPKCKEQFKYKQRDEHI